jgi:hypothetical protein
MEEGLMGRQCGEGVMNEFLLARLQRKGLGSYCNLMMVKRGAKYARQRLFFI